MVALNEKSGYVKICNKFHGISFTSYLRLKCIFMVQVSFFSYVTATYTVCHSLNRGRPCKNWTTAHREKRKKGQAPLSVSGLLDVDDLCRQNNPLGKMVVWSFRGTIAKKCVWGHSPHTTVWPVQPDWYIVQSKRDSWAEGPESLAFTIEAKYCSQKCPKTKKMHRHMEGSWILPVKQSKMCSRAANHHFLLGGGGGQEQRMNEGEFGGGGVGDLD